MYNFTRGLIITFFLAFILILYLSSSYGWWITTVRNPRYVPVYQKDDRGYYGGRGGYSSGSNSRSSRSFRGGGRGAGK